MTSKLIIHIGLHKTATSYLQFEFFKRLIDVELLNHPRFYQKFTSPIGGDSNYLISSEGISGVAWDLLALKGRHSDHKWLDAFNFGIRKLKVIYPQAIVLCFFRPHGDLLISMYKQYIHEGGVLKLEDFFGENGVITPKDLSFNLRIKGLKNTFDNVYFLDYEEFKDSGDDYLIKFFASLNIQVNENIQRVKKRNVSVSGAKLEILRKINKFYVHCPDKVKKGLYRLGITPRQIFQNYLWFWKSIDGKDFLDLKERVNQKYAEDWLLFKEQSF